MIVTFSLTYSHLERREEGSNYLDDDPFSHLLIRIWLGGRGRCVPARLLR